MRVINYITRANRWFTPVHSLGEGGYLVSAKWLDDSTDTYIQLESSSEPTFTELTYFLNKELPDPLYIVELEVRLWEGWSVVKLE